MKAVLLGTFFLLAFGGVVNAVTSSDETSTTTVDGGRPAPPALQEIWMGNLATMTDCGQLQEQFDMAEHRHELMLDDGNVDEARIASDYMSAVDDRLEAAGCHG